MMAKFSLNNHPSMFTNAPDLWCHSSYGFIPPCALHVNSQHVFQKLTYLNSKIVERGLRYITMLAKSGIFNLNRLFVHDCNLN